MRFPLRFQVLVLTGAILLLALASYVALATRLLAEDKLAYIYDLESSITATVSEQVSATLAGKRDKLAYFALDASQGWKAAALDLFSTDPDVVSVEIWQRRGGRFTQFHAHADPERLASFNLSQADVAEARRTTPVPFEAIAAEGVLLQNASLPPDVALLSLAVPAPNGQVVVAIYRPDPLLRIFARSPAYRVYLVDGKGRIVAHPEPQQVVARASAAEIPIVQQAIRGQLPRAVRQFDSPQGPVVGAFARLGFSRLAVVAEVPRHEALRGARLLARRSLLFGLGIVFLAVLASVIFARRLTAPLRRLEEATRAVGLGDFAVEVPASGRSEIGTLAAAFNRMGRELADREARLQEAHSQLVQSEKLSVLGEISASVVHEVRSPVTSIIGYARLGQESSAIPEEVRESLQLIEQAGWRANETVQTILEFARMEREPFERLDPNKVVADAVRLVKHTLLLKQAGLEVALSPDLPAVFGNANELQQVMVNLIMNAAQAMEGVPDRRLSIGTSLDGNDVVFSVKDTGIGMTPEVRQKLFTPFFTTKPRGQGTGLGLSVSRRIVRQHKGEIRVESEPGRGSTFSVHIPVAGAGEPTPPRGVVDP